MSKKNLNNKEKDNIKFDKKKKIFIILLFFVILPIALVKTILKNDTFYTIKIGEWIIHHGIDMMDHFSIHAGLPYTYPHWLYDTGIYLIYKLGGFAGIYVSTIILFIILCLLIYKTAYKITKNELAAFFSTFTGMLVLGQFAQARAQLVTYILFILEILFIECFLEKKQKRYLIGLLLISLAICNLHAAVWPFYFIVYLPYIAEYIVSLIVSKLKIKHNNKFLQLIEKKFVLEKNDNIKYLVIVMLLSTLTGLCTPIHDTPYTYFIKTAMGNSQKYIQEHKMTVWPDSIFIIAITIITYFLAIINKIKLRDIFMLSGLVIMAITSVRHLALLGLIGVLCYDRTFDLFIKGFNSKAENTFIKIVNKPITLIISTVIIITIVSVSLYNGQKAGYIDYTFYPTKAVEFIKENLNVNEIRLFNEYNYGSYLLFNDIPVYIDSRADLYTKPFNGREEDILDTYVTVLDNYTTLFEKYGITHVIAYKFSPDYYNLVESRSDFKRLYSDEYFAVYQYVPPKKIS